MNDVFSLVAIVVLVPTVVLSLIFAVREQSKDHRAQLTEGVNNETPERSNTEVGRAA
jgi:hypothetical protein